MSGSIKTESTFTVEQEQERDKKLIQRVWWRIIPLILIAYLVLLIDKTNVSFAKLQSEDSKAHSLPN